MYSIKAIQSIVQALREQLPMRAKVRAHYHSTLNNERRKKSGVLEESCERCTHLEARLRDLQAGIEQTMKATSDEHQAQSMKAQKEAADRWEAAQEQLRNLEAQLEQTRRNAEETEQENKQLSTNLVEQSREMAALKNNLVRAGEQPLRPKAEEKNAEPLVLQMSKDLKDKEIQVKELEGRVGKLQAEIHELNTGQGDPDLGRRAHGPVEEDRSQVETAIADPLTGVPAQENNGQNRPAMTEGQDAIKPWRLSNVDQCLTQTRN
jgi:chromosome segregation ATPase